MKRLHVALEVADLEGSLKFYQTLFGQAPNVVKPDYAKWQLAEPSVNFSISARGREPGVNHLGIQVDSSEELQEINTALAAAGHAVHREEQTTCCYAVSDKGWVSDPQGVAWEAFHTTAHSEEYGTDASVFAAAEQGCGCPGQADNCC